MSEPKIIAAEVLAPEGGLTFMSAFWMGALAGSAGTILVAWFLWRTTLRLLPIAFDLFETFGDRKRRR